MYKDDYKNSLSPDVRRKLVIDGVTNKHTEKIADPTYENLSKFAIDHADALIMGNADINPEIEKYAKESGKPFLEHQSDENYINAYSDFYNKLLIS